MARYIDADNFREKAFYADTEADIAHYTRLYGYEDVVPKSEVNLYKRQVDELEDELASTYDKFETAKAEAAREIFGEIEKYYCINKFGEVYVHFDSIQEIKKKYTREV